MRVVFIALFILLLLASIFYIYSRSSQPIPTPITKSQDNLAQCLIYAIHEDGRDNSQIITINTYKNEVLAVGSLHQQAELEGLDIHPVEKVLYTTTSKEGELYKVDAKTSSLTKLGQMDFAKVNSLAFRNSDSTLWGWAEEKGLVQIDPKSGKTTVIFESPELPVGLTWSKDESVIYASIEDTSELFAYNFEQKTFTKVADNLIKGTEGLSTLSDGTLLGSSTDEEDNLIIYTYDPLDKKVIKSTTFNTPYFDTEGVTWPQHCGNPFGATEQ